MEEKTVYLYVISETDQGPCKLGFSATPEKRVRQLQTGAATKLRLFHKEPVPAEKVKALEKALHGLVRHLKVSGEWFNLSTADAILEVKHAVIRYSDDMTVCR
jgi:hypothetical protein